MTKFFFKKKGDGGGPMRSQVVGIAWIIAILVAMMGWYFFSNERSVKGVEVAEERAISGEVLEKKEDSVYRSRRRGALSYSKQARYEKQKIAVEELYTREAPPVRKQVLKVELNSADTTTLQLLHGIGPAFAQRIVRYRERLGGYVADSQLLEVYGFTPALLDHVRPHLELDTAQRRRIRINSVGLKELARHPYVEYYQARDVLNLRSKGVVFRTEEDLRAVPSMADSTLMRLRPYVDYTLSVTE